MDKIAIFRRGKRFEIAFNIEEKWSHVYTQDGEVRTWPNKHQARRFLASESNRHETKYGEKLWETDKIPVIDLPTTKL